eukprot:3925195-Lingulodinium_polyedra.AAC.1
MIRTTGARVKSMGKPEMRMTSLGSSSSDNMTTLCGVSLGSSAEADAAAGVSSVAAGPEEAAAAASTLVPCCSEACPGA